MGDLVILLISAFAGVAIGFLIGYILRKHIAENKIGTAEKEAERIIEDAKQRIEEAKVSAETLRKEIVLEAKEEAVRVKNETDRELKERRNEQAKLERRVLQKEENLDKRADSLTKKEEALAKKTKENEETAAQLEKAKSEQLAKLEEICAMTADEAKQELLTRVESEARHDMAAKLVSIEKEYKERSEEIARGHIAVAIQRLASDSVAESTVSVVALPNDEMKGRIIGREGRNIRAIETMAGVDLIIDDTSEAITVSTFNPVRREIARLALEKLIADGRIHPSRIEEMIEKSRREVDQVIKKEAEQATFETGIHGINPELLKYLGQLRYRTSYGQNVLRHSIEVSHIAGMLARELGVDATLAKRAGLLHDIGKAVSHEQDGSHVQLGVELARKYKENRDVIHAIEAHHGDVEPHTLVAMLVQAADAISAARPGARRENLESYIKRLKRLEEISEEFEGVEKAYAIQAGREIRVMIDPEKISDDDMVFLTREIAAKIENELEYPGQIKIHTIREKRVFEYAR